MAIGIETERKFIIRIPDLALIKAQAGYEKSEIVQTYFESDKGVTHRVRARATERGVRYTETKKTRISSSSVIEDECEITKEEYEHRLAAYQTVGRDVHKTRHIFTFGRHTFEIDVYPEWKRCCIMEVELSQEDEEMNPPPFIEILSEVTGVKGYSNHAMSLSFPEEPF